MAETRELSTLYHNALNPCIEDKELSSLYLKATQNYDDLPREDRFRIALYIQKCFRMFEQHFVHIQERKVDQLFVDSINLSFEEWLTFPGIQQWWNNSKDMFVPNFRTHVYELIKSANLRGYSSSFEEK